MANEPEKDVQQPTQEGQEAPVTPEKKKPLLPPSRIAFLIFLVVAGVVIVMELSAKWPYEKSVRAIEEKMPENLEGEEAQKQPGLYRQDLDELLSGNPIRQPDEENRRETITWNGALKFYRVKLRYARGGYVSRFYSEDGWRWEE